MNKKQLYKFVIPDDWQLSNFGQVCELILDGTHFSPKSTEGPYKYITSKNIRNEGLKLDDVQYVSEKEHRSIYARCPVLLGDILLTKDGANAGVCCLNNLSEEFSLLSSVAALRSNGELMENNFLLQFIKSPVGQKVISDEISGQAITRITLEKIRRFRVVVPPLSEQKAIARVLGVTDDAINKTSQLLVKKRLQKKYLMQVLLTGKKRLRGFDSDWNKVGAGDLFKSVSIKNCPSEELLSATQDKGIVPRSYSEGRVTMPSGETNSYKLVEPGDFVISLRSFQGGLEYSEFRGIVSPAYTVLKSKKSISSEFYKQYFKSYDFIGHLATAVIGIRDGKQISYDDFCLVKIPYPHIDEQSAIAYVLQTADKEIDLIRSTAEKLRQQKKWMMQVLLTGKMRLKVRDQ